MTLQERYVYHIKDEFFEKVNDKFLMSNKENGTYRPTYYCIRDKNNPDLLWMVPMSTKVEKYQSIYDRQLEKYGNCLTIVIGEYSGKKSAFLLQNMFPITKRYIDHIHTIQGNAVPVKMSTATQIRSNMQQLLQLINKGKKVVFPDVKRIKSLMLQEINAEVNHSSIQNDLDKEKTREQLGFRDDPQPKMSIKDHMAAAQAEADRRNNSRLGDQQPQHNRADITKDDR